MGTSRKVTSKVRERIAYWKTFSLGRDVIASKLKSEGFEVSARTVSRVLMALTPSTLAQESTLPAKPSRSRRASIAARGADAADRAASTLATTGAEVGDVLADLRSRLAEVRGIANELAPLSKQGGRNAGVYCQLVRLEGDLAARVHELTPPTPPDPSSDPTNVRAKELLLATIEGLVSQHEEAHT